MTLTLPIATPARRFGFDPTKRMNVIAFGFLSILVLGLLTLQGCAGHSTNSANPYNPQTETARNPLRSQELTLQAADLIAKDLAKAESLLREALGFDLYHGPAHNNLGVVYLKQGKLYEAASEFEWAKKLLPGHPDPRMNLALTLEKAGRIDDALDTYRTALEVYPDHLPTIQAMTRLQVRAGRSDPLLPERLQAIALRGEPSWRAWARERLAR